MGFLLVRWSGWYGRRLNKTNNNNRPSGRISGNRKWKNLNAAPSVILVLRNQQCITDLKLPMDLQRNGITAMHVMKSA
jgi:hypothetical protein